MKYRTFKFLDYFNKEDLPLFHGRNEEIEDIYSRLFHSEVFLLYGRSGTGKTSLLRCGLWSRLGEHDWLPLYVTREGNINDSLHRVAAQTSMRGLGPETSLVDKIQTLYLEHFKPVYLIIDQLEELFVFGDRGEQEDFIAELRALSRADCQIKIIFSLREEYLASIVPLERAWPDLLSNRYRLEAMGAEQARDAISGSCLTVGIDLEEGAVSDLISFLRAPDTGIIELPYLQIALHELQQAARKRSPARITCSDVRELGDLSQLMSVFLHRRLGQVSDRETARGILKRTVSAHGTKRSVPLQELEKSMPEWTRADILQAADGLIRAGILQEKKAGQEFSLRHDVLAPVILDQMSLPEKKILELTDMLVSRYREYERNRIYLDAQSLKVIEPYEDALPLGPEVDEFVRKSRQQLRRQRRIRAAIYTVFASLAFLIITSLGLFSVYKYRQADVELDRATRMLRNNLGAYWLLALNYDFSDGKLDNLELLDRMVQAMQSDDHEQMLELSREFEELLRRRGLFRKESRFYSEWVKKHPEYAPFDFDTIYANLYHLDPDKTIGRFAQDMMIFYLFWPKEKLASMSNMLNVLLDPRHPAIFDKYGPDLSPENRRRLEFSRDWMRFCAEPSDANMAVLLKRSLFKDIVLGQAYSFGGFFRNWSVRTFFGYYFSQEFSGAMQYFKRPPKRMASLLVHLKNVLDNGRNLPEGMKKKVEELCARGMYLMQAPEVLFLSPSDRSREYLNLYPAYLLPRAEDMLKKNRNEQALALGREILDIYPYDPKGLKVVIDALENLGREKEAAAFRAKKLELWGEG